MSAAEFIRPDWPAPANVGAASSTRIGGVSAAPFDGFNVGDHVGDDPAAIASNRAALVDRLGLPGEPRWLQQMHGTRVVHAAGVEADRVADACWSDRPGDVCAVMTADCLPVLFCDHRSSCVAAAHAGWRGLQGGVLENTVAALPAAPAELLAWLGPAIGPNAFEVGDEVREAFCDSDAVAAAAFVPASRAGHWLADLYTLARQRLRACGVRDISGGQYCTHASAERFFSYRRDGKTGRMVSLVWIRPEM